MFADIPELLLLHALPLDGSMWAAQLDLLPGATYAPTLYGFGERVEDWAIRALELTKGNRILLVGCSIGGSCALEIAALAPERIAAMVLIGTKAARRRDPEFHASALKTLRDEGLEAGWREWWEPAFSTKTPPAVVDEAKRLLDQQSLDDVMRGVEAFHTRPSRDHVLSTFAKQVHVVTGADDFLPGLETSTRQVALAEKGRLHVVPDCGHYVPMERPEALNSILRPLIAEL